MSGSPTIMQYFITIRSGVSDRRIEIVFTRLLFFVFFIFFVCRFFRQASAETASPILTLNTSYGVVPRKGVPLGVPLMMFSIYGVKSTKNRSKWAWIGNFQANRKKSLNFDIIKTTEPISTKFCTVIKTPSEHRGWSRACVQTNPRWRTAAILKILNF